MPTYIVLANMTQQGIKTVNEIPQRREAAKEAAKALGITWRDGFVTMGQYDVVFILDAPDGETMAKFGRIDLLVNNAGVAPKVRADLLDAGEESFDRLFAINLKGPYFLTQLVAKQMLRQL